MDLLCGLYGLWGSGWVCAYPPGLVMLVAVCCSSCVWFSEGRLPYRFDELYPSEVVDVSSRRGLIRLGGLFLSGAVDVCSREGLMRRGACTRSYALWYWELLLTVWRGAGGRDW